MINLRVVLLSVRLDGTGFERGRVTKIIEHLASAFGREMVPVQENELGQVQERLRRFLKEGGIAPATIRNLVYRLGKLLAAAREQGLLPTEQPNFDPQFPMPPHPSEATPAKRRYDALEFFRRWCTQERIHFGEVSYETFGEYRKYLKSPERALGPARGEVLYLDLVAAWVEQVTSGCFPKVDSPRWNDESSSRYGLPRRCWPPGVECEFARLERGARGNPLPGDKRWPRPLRQSSLEVIQGELERLLGYAANIRKIDISEARMSELLGDESGVLEFIQWHCDERCNGEERHYHKAWLDRYAAIHKWLSNEERTAEKYRAAATSLAPRRVRDPFPSRPIDYAEFAEAAICAIAMAVRAWRAAASDVGSKGKTSAACTLRDAVCFALLICRPMRSHSIRSMKLGENLVKTSSDSWRLQFADHEMKTRSYSCEFPRPVAEALELYIQAARPVLLGARNNATVFPTKSGLPLSPQDLWRRITAIGLEYLSVKTNPHLFRYIVPCAYLLRHPDKLIEMQALLGHSNLAVTLRCYVHVYSQVASRRVAELQRANCPSLRRLGELLPPS